MKDIEQEVIDLWNDGHGVEEIAEMYGEDEEVIESIVEDPANYADD